MIEADGDHFSEDREEPGDRAYSVSDVTLNGGAGAAETVCRGARFKKVLGAF